MLSTRDKKLQVVRTYPDDGYALKMCLARLPAHDSTSPPRFCRAKTRENRRCVAHDGRGKFSEAVLDNDGVLDAYERLREDSTFMNLKEDLAVLRGVAIEFMQRMNEAPTVTDTGATPKVNYARTISDVLDKAGKTVERIQKLQAGILAPELLADIMKSIVGIIIRSVDRCPHCGKSLADTQQEVFRGFTQYLRSQART